MSRRKPFKQFVHLGDNPPDKITYEVHLDPPYIPEGAEGDRSKWVRNYIGSAERDRLMERVYKDHGTVNGARVLQVQRQAGGTWHLVRTWAGGVEKEQQLKQQAGTRYCPECTQYPRQGDSPPKEHYKSRRERREAQRLREAPQFEPAEPVRNAREMSYDEAQAAMAGPKQAEETPERTAFLWEVTEKLIAGWTRDRQQMELEAGLYEREGCHGHGGPGMAAAG